MGRAWLGMVAKRRPVGSSLHTTLGKRYSLAGLDPGGCSLGGGPLGLGTVLRTGITTLATES